MTAAVATLPTPEQGAEPSVHAASAPELENVTGKVFADRRDLRGKPASHGAADEAQAKRLWDVCAKLTDLTP